MFKKIVAALGQVLQLKLKRVKPSPDYAETEASRKEDLGAGLHTIGCANPEMSVKDGVQSAWDEVKDDANTEVDWMLCGYVSKKEIDVIGKGSGGRKACLAQIVSDKDIVFGGFRVTAIDARENLSLIHI